MLRQCGRNSAGAFVRASELQIQPCENLPVRDLLAAFVDLTCGSMKALTVALPICITLPAAEADRR